MRCRRAFGLVELIVAMAVLAVLAASGTASYTAIARRAHTSVAAAALDRLGTLLEAYRSFAVSESYPTDAVNAAGQPNAGAQSYDALIADLASDAPAPAAPYASVFASWTYQPGPPAAIQGPCCAGIGVQLAVGPDGSAAGTFGGVPVEGSVAGGGGAGTLALSAGGAAFAYGSYTCGGGCVFSGTVSGTALSFDLTGDPAQGGRPRGAVSVAPEPRRVGVVRGAVGEPAHPARQPPRRDRLGRRAVAVAQRLPRSSARAHVVHHRGGGP